MSTNTQYTEAIARIKDKLDIVQVISEYVILKKAGRNYIGLCPFHKEKTPSFSVNPVKQIFKCFGCGAAGDAIAFLMKIHNQNFNEVIADLAQKFGIELPQFKGGGASNTELKKQLLKANKLAAEFYHKALDSYAQGKKVKDYLAKRDITDNVIKDYMIGYSPNQPSELMDYLKKEHGFSDDILEKAGLLSQRSNGQGYLDRFRNRLMIPIMDENDNVIGFGARALEDGQNPKYLNSPDSILYNKSKVMFGLNKAKEAIREKDSAIIMEGYFDVIRAQVNGVKNVVASSGTSLTQGHLKTLSRYMNERRIYLAFDSDSAGQAATLRGAEVVKEAFMGLGEIKQYDESFGHGEFSCEIRVVVSAEGKDPDEFIKAKGGEAYLSLVEKAPLLIDFEIDSIIKTGGKDASPQEKAKVIKKIVKVLSQVQNQIIRSEYIKTVAQSLDVSQMALRAELDLYQAPATPSEQASLSNVTKTSTKLQIAQKKLLSCYFVDGSNIPPSTLNNYLDEVEFTEETLSQIKKSLREISEQAENTEILQKMLIDGFVGQIQAQQEIIDIINYSGEIKDLGSSLMKQYIEETVFFIKRARAKQVQNELKSRYYEAKDDEMSSQLIQYEVRDKLKQVNRLKLGDIHEQKI
ncbi:MAG: DNA primase [Candidatus Gastranaerophilales bacterium]|nr:DNA primase [Candidatus Gastranaerophilales bacterium]